MTLKKLFAGLISLAASLLAVCAITVCAGAETSGDYEYSVLEDGTVEITKYTGSATDLEIPSTLDGKKVTEIGRYAFEHCSSLTSINIPDSVTSIGGYAFEYCSSLASINIPDSVKCIEAWTFYNCSSLTSITIPNSVTSIGGSAFYDCISLKSITIPESVTAIGGDAFSHCSSLDSINVDQNNPNYSSEKGVLFNEDKTELITCPDAKTGYYSIPYSVVGIGLAAFEGCSNLTSITIPDGVRSIGIWAFSGCSSLTSLKIPDTVKSIGSSAFYECSSLTSINIPDGLTSIENWTFEDCSSLTSITIPDSVTSIGDSAFSLCSSLTSINIPDDVTSIGNWTFAGCSSLTSITIPNRVTSIGDYAFTGCSNLASINIPDGVTSIGDWAFDGCSNITSITLPDSVTKIGDGAFYDCSSLTSINIPDSVTSIGELTFYGCSSLTSINIPAGVTSIGEEAFTECFSLSTITVDKNNANYSSKDGVLFNKSMTEIITYPVGQKDKYVIPDGVTSIGCAAFALCEHLTSITIPESVTSIEADAFYGCSSLTSINIPAGVTSIGEEAFIECFSLSTITVDKNNANYSSKDGVLFNKSMTEIIAYPTGKKDKYAIPDGVTSIGYAAFALCENLTSITIPESVTNIEDYAFYLCKEFEDVYYTGSKEQWDLITIGEYNEELLSATIHYNYIPAPSPVTGLKLKARAADALRLTWDENANADGYIIEMKSGAKWVRVGKITNNSTVEFKKSKLKAGTAYTFRVKAYKMSGKTALYSGYTTISARTNPSVITGLKLKARAADALRLTWTKNTSADGYIIEMKSGNSWVRVGKITKNSTVEFKKSGLKAGTAYTFRVKAYKMSGKTALYGTAKTISVRTNPSAVSGLKLKASAKNAIRLSWTKNTSADGYIIEQKVGNSWTRVGKIAKNLTVEFKKSGLKSKTSYSFRIKAYKMSGSTALYGATKTITVKTK